MNAFPIDRGYISGNNRNPALSGLGLFDGYTFFMELPTRVDLTSFCFSDFFSFLFGRVIPPKSEKYDPVVLPCGSGVRRQKDLQLLHEFVLAAGISALALYKAAA